MNRRSFLGAILATATAPYVMSSGIAKGVLMPVRQRIIVGSELDKELLLMNYFTAEAIRILQSNIKLVRTLDAKPMPAGSYSVSIRRPQRYAS